MQQTGLSPDTIFYPQPDSAALVDTGTGVDTIAGDTLQIVEDERPIYYKGVERTFSQSADSDSWLFLVLAFLTLYIGAQRLWAFGGFRKRIRAMFNLRLANQYFREEESEGGIGRVVYDVFYLLAISVAVYFVIRYFAGAGQEIAPLGLFALIMGAVFCLYLLKWLLSFVLSGLFEFGPILHQFQFHDHIQNYLAALVLLPFLWLAAFAGSWIWPITIWAIIGIIGLAILLRYVRGLTLVFPSIRGFVFPFILYICTLEIAPVVAIIKGLDILLRVYLS